MEPEFSLVDRVDAVLPQTQCRQCGYDGCRPYAAAIAGGEAEIDRCPPGGQAGVMRLAQIMGRTPIALNPACGPEKPLALAVIDESLCIGCTLCIQACPVDAIVGAARRMHDVVAELCTGCELCLPPCPVDCIVMKPAGFAWDDAHATAARDRHALRARRLAREPDPRRPAPRSATEIRPAVSSDRPGSPDPRQRAQSRKSAIIAAAIERAEKRQRERQAAGRNGR